MRNVYDEQMNERVGVNYNHNQLGTANFPERFCFCFFGKHNREQREEENVNFLGKFYSKNV